MTTRIPPALLAAMLVLPSGAAELGAVAVDRSTIAFVAHQMNVPVEGRFGRFTVQLSFDPAKAGRREGERGHRAREYRRRQGRSQRHRGRQGLARRQGVSAGAFRLQRLQAAGGNRYEAQRQAHHQGSHAGHQAPFTFTPHAAGGAFDGAFALKRADFAIGEGMWADFGTVANEIQIQFHMAASARRSRFFPTFESTPHQELYQ